MEKSGNYENPGALPEHPRSKSEPDGLIQRKEVVAIGNNPIEGKPTIAAMPAAQTKRQIQHTKKKE